MATVAWERRKNSASERSGEYVVPAMAGLTAVIGLLKLYVSSATVLIRQYCEGEYLATRVSQKWALSRRFA